MPIDDTKSFTINIPARIKKMSICYGSNFTYTDAYTFIATHFDLVDTNRNYGSPVVNAKIINPALNVIGYNDATFMSNKYNNCALGCWSEVNANESWFLHDITWDGQASTGAMHRIGYSSYYPDNWLMNPNSGWADYYISHCKASLDNYPAYDGTFNDDCVYKFEDNEGSYCDVNGNNLPTSNFPSPYDGVSKSTYGPFVVALIQNYKNAIGTKMTMPNTWKYTQFCEAAHSMLWEGFIHSRTSASTAIGYSGSYQYGCYAINLLHQQALLGNIIATNSGCATTSPDLDRLDWLKFCLACLLLAVGTDITTAYFSWHFYGHETTGSIINGYHPIMDTNFGQPVQNYTGNIQNSSLQVHAHSTGGDCGGYSYCGGVFVREYQNYYIIANLSPSFSTTYDYTGILPNGTPYTVKARKALFIEL